MSVVLSRRLAARLPSVGVLPAGAPRYPNLWLHSQAGPEATDAALEAASGMVDDFAKAPTEGADAWGRTRRLEPVELEAERSHDHQLHLRLHRQALDDEAWVEVDGRRFHRTGVSVHYEVDRPRALHPYVEECPACGCTSRYARWAGADRHRLDTWVHDPMGLELVLEGTVSGRWVPGVQGLMYTGAVADVVTLGTDELAEVGWQGPAVAVVLLGQP